MAEPSLYKEAPTVAVVDGRPTLNTDTEGVATVEVSPTGAPGIPPAAVPWITGLVALALVAARTLPPHTVAAQVAGGLVDVAVLLGLASPGWRRK